MSVFWDDLAEDLQDPAFRRQFLTETLRVEIMRQAASPFVTGAVIDCGRTISVEQPNQEWFNLSIEELADAIERVGNPAAEATRRPE